MEFLIRLRLLKSNSIIFQHALPVYFYLLHKQAVHGLFDHETLEGVANAFRLFFGKFSLFCQKVDFFHPLNRNDDLKESESELESAF